MMSQELVNLWQLLRNDSWKKQEEFVMAIIEELVHARSTLQDFADDKYVGNSGFKYADGTVRSRVHMALDGLRERINRILKDSE